MNPALIPIKGVGKGERGESECGQGCAECGLWLLASGIEDRTESCPKLG